MKKTRSNKLVLPSKFVASSTIFILFLFSLSFVSAVGFTTGQNLGTFPQGTALISQTCDNSSYSNITSIYYPQSSSYILKQETIMNKSGDLYNYTLSYVNQTGHYTTTGHCDENGVDTSWTTSFDIGTDVSLTTFIIFLVIVILAMGLAIYTKDSGMEIIAAFAITLFAVYMFNNGIGIYRNQFTDGLSIIVGAIGLGIGYDGIWDLLDI